MQADLANGIQPGFIERGIVQLRLLWICGEQHAPLRWCPNEDVPILPISHVVHKGEVRDVVSKFKRGELGKISLGIGHAFKLDLQGLPDSALTSVRPYNVGAFKLPQSIGRFSRNDDVMVRL